MALTKIFLIYCVGLLQDMALTKPARLIQSKFVSEGPKAIKKVQCKINTPLNFAHNLMSK